MGAPTGISRAPCPKAVAAIDRAGDAAHGLGMAPARTRTSATADRPMLFGGAVAVAAAPIAAVAGPSPAAAAPRPAFSGVAYTGRVVKPGNMGGDDYCFDLAGFVPTAAVRASAVPVLLQHGFGDGDDDPHARLGGCTAAVDPNAGLVVRGTLIPGDPLTERVVAHAVGGFPWSLSPRFQPIADGADSGVVWLGEGQSMAVNGITVTGRTEPDWITGEPRSAVCVYTRWTIAEVSFVDVGADIGAFVSEMAMASAKRLASGPRRTNRKEPIAMTSTPDMQPPAAAGGGNGENAPEAQMVAPADITAEWLVEHIAADIIAEAQQMIATPAEDGPAEDGTAEDGPAEGGAAKDGPAEGQSGEDGAAAAGSYAPANPDQPAASARSTDRSFAAYRARAVALGCTPAAAAELAGAALDAGMAPAQLDAMCAAVRGASATVAPAPAAAPAIAPHDPALGGSPVLRTPTGSAQPAAHAAGQAPGQPVTQPAASASEARAIAERAWDSTPGLRARYPASALTRLPAERRDAEAKSIYIDQAAAEWARTGRVTVAF